MDGSRGKSTGRRLRLHDLFPPFGGSVQGVALLGLRLAIGMATFAEMRPGVAAPYEQSFPPRVLAVLIAIGLLTPVASSALLLYWLIVSADRLAFHPLTVAVLLALILLGPGVVSIDAKLFGRRRLIIPSKPGHRPASGT